MRGITLIGMPGAGKSTVGRLLAEKLGFAFIDLDNLIRDKEGKSHSQIISEHGDQELVRLEESHTLNLNLENTVFAPGGSIVYSPAAMGKLTRETLIIYLSVPIGVIEKNIGDQIDHRGIVGLSGRGLEGVFDERRPFYEKYAHFQVDCGNRDAASIADQVSSLIA